VGISQNYHFDAVGDRDELVRFWGQKVKGQGHSETTYGQISICLTSLQSARTYFNETQLLTGITRSILHCWHLQGHGSKFKVTDNIFWKSTFPVEAYWSTVAVKDRLVWLLDILPCSRQYQSCGHCFQDKEKMSKLCCRVKHVVYCF